MGVQEEANAINCSDLFLWKVLKGDECLNEDNKTIDHAHCHSEGFYYWEETWQRKRVNEVA